MDELIQKFLDGELTSAERRALLRLLDERPDVRQELRTCEAVLDEAARLPRLDLPVDFVARTMERLPAAPRARRAMAWPRARYAWLAAATLVFAVGFFVGRAQAPQRIVPVAALDVDPVPREILVRLVLIEPRAQVVTVVGDFNGWDSNRTPLRKGEGGAFHVSLSLPPGRYHYMYVVDGKEWKPDPSASETSLDGFGSQNSVLDVEI